MITEDSETAKAQQFAAQNKMVNKEVRKAKEESS
jgi:hypothetical protein